MKRIKVFYFQVVYLGKVANIKIVDAVCIGEALTRFLKLGFFHPCYIRRVRVLLVTTKQAYSRGWVLNYSGK